MRIGGWQHDKGLECRKGSKGYHHVRYDWGKNVADHGRSVLLEEPLNAGVLIWVVSLIYGDRVALESF